MPGIMVADQSVIAAKEATEAAHHFHSYERWMGLAASPSGETHRADAIAATIAPFQADAGNDGWGAWLQLLGSSDTPIIAGKRKYDLHRVEIVAAERKSALHMVQVAFGESGAAAIAAGTYTELVFVTPAAGAQDIPVPIRHTSPDAGTKAWVRFAIPDADTGTVDFYIGIHEYDE